MPWLEPGRPGWVCDFPLHNKSWHHISEGLFSRVRIKQCSATFPAALLLSSRQYLSSYAIILLSPSIARDRCGQHCPSPLCWCAQTLSVCRLLTPSAGCVGLCPPALLIDRGDAGPAELPVALQICRKKPIAQTLIRIDHTLPTDKGLCYSSP